MKDGAWVALVWFAALASSVRAQEPLAPARIVEAQEQVIDSVTAKSETEELPFTPSSEFQSWLTNLVREHIPHEYEKRKNWGNTERKMSGLSIQLDDGRLKTHRKFVEANDGKWTHYRVRLVDPDEQFEVRVSQMREIEGGRVAMEVSAVAKLDVFGRQSVWTRGIQLFSLSAEADARVRFTAHVEVATRIDPTVFPPDVYLAPSVTTAKLDIVDFKLRRISRADGPLVRALSHSVREMLEDKLAEDNEKLVAKLNKQLAKQEDKLKLSLSEMVRMKSPEAASDND
jgi:hypothetical protein